MYLHHHKQLKKRKLPTLAEIQYQLGHDKQPINSISGG